MPVDARADWLLTPFVGLKFAGATTFVDLEGGAEHGKLTLGGSAGFLGNGVLGAEVDAGYTPRFFNADGGGRFIVASDVVSLSGNVIAAAPIELTRESLRPYLIAGLGLLHARINYTVDALDVNRTLFAMSAGGGAIGAISRRTSLRFDLRYLKSISDEAAAGAGFGTARLSFWRAVAGVTFRY